MKLEETIRILYDAGVEFVVIGGAAMGLQGSAHLTKDIDFCYARTNKNMERLAKALEPFHPVLRGAPPGLPFRFDAKTIASGLNFALTTDLGDLDFRKRLRQPRSDRFPVIKGPAGNDAGMSVRPQRFRIDCFDDAVLAHLSLQ